MTLLDTATWEGRVFTGTWTTGGGDDIVATEPATGQALTLVGGADAADVRSSAAPAARDQRDWAARPYLDRARVLRRAGALFEEHAQEIETWIVRESGAIRPFAQMQAIRGVAEDCHEAAPLSAPYGEVLHPGQQRLSWPRPHHELPT